MSERQPLSGEFNLDLIDEQLTEINITCPTGIVQISELEGRNFARETVEYFVKVMKNHRK